MASKKDKVDNAVIIDDDAAVLALCPDLPQWPQGWCIEPADLAVGKQIAEAFTPFLRHLIGQGLAPKTSKRHRDHLWILGGELIRRRYDDPDLNRLSVTELPAESIDDETGPLIWPRITESQQDAFDATCRKQHRFLVETSAVAH